MNKTRLWLVGLALLLAGGCQPTTGDPDFEKIVLRSDRPVLVDFYATWCGPCKTMEPVVSALKTEYDNKAMVYKVDVDEYSGTARQYRVTGVPTFLVFKDGQITARFVGVTDKSELAAALDAAIE
jgi:thioredoxin 1